MSFKELTLEEALSGKTGDEPEQKPTVEDEVRELRAQVASLQEQLTPKLKRSQMADKEKHNYIRQHGASKYFELPWD